MGVAVSHVRPKQISAGWGRPCRPTQPPITQRLPGSSQRQQQGWPRLSGCTGTHWHRHSLAFTGTHRHPLAPFALPPPFEKLLVTFATTCTLVYVESKKVCMQPAAKSPFEPETKCPLVVGPPAHAVLHSPQWSKRPLACPWNPKHRSLNCMRYKEKEKEKQKGKRRMREK